jgi:hypothetical protein
VAETAFLESGGQQRRSSRAHGNAGMNLCGLTRAATGPLAADVFQPKHPGVLPKVMTAPVSVVGLHAQFERRAPASPACASSARAMWRRNDAGLCDLATKNLPVFSMPAPFFVKSAEMAFFPRPDS